MATFRPSANRITSWLPPGSGPTRPANRSRRINSRRLIGFGIGWPRIQVDTVDNFEPVAMAQSHNDPAFQSFLKLFASFLQGRSFSPRSRTLLDLSKESTVLDHFVVRPPHRRLNVLSKHGGTIHRRMLVWKRLSDFVKLFVVYERVPLTMRGKFQPHTPLTFVCRFEGRSLSRAFWTPRT